MNNTKATGELVTQDRRQNAIAQGISDVFERRMQDRTMESILADYPPGDRDELVEQVDALARRLNSLIEATNKAREAMSLDLILTRLMTLITEAFDADRSSIFLYDADSNELFSRVAEGAEIDEIRFPAASGIAGSVFTNGESLVIEDAYADARFNPAIDTQTGYTTNSIVCVPIRTRLGDTIGVAQVLNKAHGVFNHADSVLLRAFTTHVAAALENMQLSERTQLAIREESRIIELTRAVSSELDIDRLLRKIMSVSSELLEAERSTLFLYDPSRDELWSRVAEGLDNREIRIASTQGIAGEAFSRREVINITDAYMDPRFNQRIDRETGFKTRSILCVPVIDKHDAPIGVVQVLNRRGGSFSSRDQRRLEMLAAQSAIALDNARLFSEVLEERNYNENVLRSLTNGVVTFDPMLNVVKINDAAARILKRDPKKLLGRDARSVFTGTNTWIAEALQKTSTERRAEVSLDTEISTAIGQSIAVNINLAPLFARDGVFLGVTMVVEDITSEKRVRSTMARYMTREVAEQVLEQGNEVLGGQSQLATIAFADIENFTALSERIGPQQTVSLLNEYFSEMVEVVFSHHGVLDKYIGDAMMAVFGVPISTSNDADNAVQMAIEMRRVLGLFNAKRLANMHDAIDIRIGICSDEIVAGNIGSDRRMDYTVIGDGVNLAARLESANKQFGTHTLLSASTVDLLSGNYVLREIDLLRVKGKRAPVAVYELIGAKDIALDDKTARLLECYADGLKAYRVRDWRRAYNCFDTACTLAPDDKPSDILWQRAAHYLAHPPPEDWDGVWRLNDK